MERIIFNKMLYKNPLTRLTNQFGRSTIIIRRWHSKKSKNISEIETKSDNEIENNDKEKTIKVAIIGAPNAGKSSFINTITNHRICPISRKVHTTLEQSETIMSRKKTQMIFFDTPGLTTVNENKKYNLGDKFLRECNESIKDADLIAVLHDVSNSYTRNVLHPTILEALIIHPTVPSILIMNKTDMVRSKRILLDLVKILTEGTLICNERRYLPWKGREEEFLKDMARPVKYKNQKSAGWPYFSDVFMVSALSGDGIGRVSNYIYNRSIEKPWEYPRYQFTNQSPEDLILNNVRSVLLDFLPNEVPYKLKCEMELFEVKNKCIHAFVNIHAENDRIEKLIAGIDSKRLKQISEMVCSHIIQLYNVNVNVVLNVVSKYKRKPLMKKEFTLNKSNNTHKPKP
ncbi:GTPase Era, mitochondrial [Contarinia nasturtii]|uniref:GTPase Era, mitochondrial n=1 Tax=Contarinia nasturtii TaxID=265458 RepID=UPI0012D37913|nr:GTPase Era, mitochondrial [Contarinia nasturtii]